MKITTEILNIDYKKRLEIMENTNYIKNKLFENNFDSRFFNKTLYFLDIIKTYKKLYDKNITILEETCIILYTIFPENKKFTKILRINEYDQEKVASLYSVNKSLVRIMYLNVLDIYKKQNEANNEIEDVNKKLLN